VDGSPARPSARALAEESFAAFIRTLKEQLLWVRYFATIEELRLALLGFMDKYNRQWRLEKHGYRTPAQVRADTRPPPSGPSAGSQRLTF